MRVVFAMSVIAIGTPRRACVVVPSFVSATSPVIAAKPAALRVRIAAMARSLQTAKVKPPFPRQVQTELKKHQLKVKKAAKDEAKSLAAKAREEKQKKRKAEQLKKAEEKEKKAAKKTAKKAQKKKDKKAAL